MTKHVGLLAMAGIIIGFSTLTAVGDELQTIQDKIHAAWAKHKSMRCKLTQIAHLGPAVGTPGGHKKGTFEFARKGDQVLTRTELSTVAAEPGKQQPVPEPAIIAIVDGEYIYTTFNLGKQIIAQKRDLDPRLTNEPRTLFQKIEEDYNLKLLPEATVDGHKVYVIEATPKKPAAARALKAVLSFQQESGFLVRNVQCQPDGQPVHTTSYTDLELGVDIDPQRFVFKLPEGATLVDQSKKKSVSPESPQSSTKPGQPQKPKKPVTP